MKTYRIATIPGDGGQAGGWCYFFPRPIARPTSV
jgi:hypothetical protein